MSIIDDLVTDVNNYPVDNVELDLAISGFGTHISQGELGTFTVSVRNTGHLDMNNLKLHVRASSFTSVGFVPWSMSDFFLSGSKDVKAHSTRNFGAFFLRANSPTGDQGTDNEELLSVHISSYDASLHHILNDHSHHASQPEDTIVRHIHPR